MLDVEMTGRIHTFGESLRRRFPFKVRKIGVDAGFTCPNRDGAKAWGGCVYCDNRSFSLNAGSPDPLEAQIARGIERSRRHGVEHFIVYFQAYTNTYGPVARLRELYESALRFPEVVGISVGTRPDCLSNAVLDLLSELTERTAVWLEIGLESSHDRSLRWMNRAHTYADFEDTVRRSAGRPFDRAVHLIYGLPGESHDDMMETTDRVAATGFDSVKVHHLYVARGTPLEEMHARGEVRLLTFEEWIPLAADIVERLPIPMSIQRLCGELCNDFLIAPRWGMSTPEIQRAVEEELARRGTRQGSRNSQHPTPKQLPTPNSQPSPPTVPSPTLGVVGS